MKAAATVSLAIFTAANLVSAHVAGGQRSPGTAALTGRVVIADTTGDSARNAVVTLNSTSAAIHRTTVADADGRFAFQRLPAGAYSVAASKPGYVTTGYGARRPGRPGTPVAVAEGARVEVELRLPRGAVITGRVSDERGTAAYLAAVHVLQYRWVNGRRILTSPAGVDAPAAIADDRGEYRIYGLTAGEYVVAAAPGIGSPLVNSAREIGAWEFQKAVRILEGRGGAGLSRPPSRVSGHAPVFYPGTSDITGAQPLILRAGEERRGVDLAMTLVPVATITGTIVLPAGVPPSAVQVSMLPAGDHLPPQGIGTGAALLGFANARPDLDGRFQITGVTPGESVLVARSAVKSEIHSAVTNVSANGEDVAVVLTLQPAATVTGRVEWHTIGIAPDRATGVRVRLSLIDASEGVVVAAPPAAVGPDGTFTLTGIAPGRRYRVDVLGVTAPWTFTSASWAGRDVFDAALDLSAGDPADPLVLTLSDTPSELSGRLQNAVGQSAPEYFVIVFPTDRSHWTWQSRRIQAVRPSTDGRYLVRGLPAGEYLVAVVGDVETNEWFDPAFLQILAPAAVKIAIATGQQTALNLRIGGADPAPVPLTWPAAGASLP